MGAARRRHRVEDRRARAQRQASRRRGQLFATGLLLMLLLSSWSC